MDAFAIITLIGGLAFFLYGITVMSAGLEKVAGGKLEYFLKSMTSSRWKGLGLGMGITAIIQSSSAVTVMLVGLVNSGIMSLSQSVGVIMGSNIGTTITAWLLSLAGIQGTENVIIRCFKPETFTPILAMIGVAMIMAAKSNKRKNVGSVLIGFAVLMFGMQVMTGAMLPLADDPNFGKIMVAFTNPFLGVLVGTVMTVVIQSSSAAVGILQALSIVGGVTFGIAIPLIMGQNLGACISSVLASIGVSTNAKRVAVIHVLFNLFGVVLFLSAFLIINALIDFPLMNKATSPVQIALFHTVFNVVTTGLLFPFTKQLEKLSKMVIPEHESDKQSVIIDDRLLMSPSFAVSECQRQTLKMAELVEFNIVNSAKMLKSYHKKKAEQILENEKLIDRYEDKLDSFLLKLSGTSLLESESGRITQMLLLIGDYERMGDHATNILKCAEMINESDNKLSEDAINEIKVIVHATREAFSMAYEAYKTDNIEIAQKVEPLEAVIKKAVRRSKNNHIQRLKDGQCNAEISFAYSDLMNDLRRIAAHCGNIATGVLQYSDTTLHKHEYNHRNKEEDLAFVNEYRDYKSRYSVQKRGE
ncbi:MAG: Na/Pi cotransporter family protein [bacterium]|nr:Na/Pi cotransporter family protein [bacterium]